MSRIELQAVLITLRTAHVKNPIDVVDRENADVGFILQALRKVGFSGSDGIRWTAKGSAPKGFGPRGPETLNHKP